jgi:hypothetical protein
MWRKLSGVIKDTVSEFPGRLRKTTYNLTLSRLQSEILTQDVSNTKQECSSVGLSRLVFPRNLEYKTITNM